jgi:hypothetical protein
LAAFSASFANFILVYLKLEVVPFFPLYILEPTAILAGMLLTYFHHTRSSASTNIVLLFWPLYITAILIWARTMYNVNRKFTLTIILKAVVGLLGFTSFTLECFGPLDVNRDGFGKAEAESLILTANIFSIWSFTWLTPMMQKGARRFITEEDLPSLRPKDKSDYLGHCLEEALKKQ